MNTVEEILYAASDTHQLPLLRIIETGCADTKDIAVWCSHNDRATFITADLDSNTQAKIHKELEELNVAKFYTIKTQDHMKFLTEQTWIDVAFLNPENLQSGLNEFHLALSAGARLVVVRGYQSKGALAVQQARRFGWSVQHAGDYSVLVRPAR